MYVCITCTVVSINEAKEKLSVNIMSKKKRREKEKAIKQITFGAEQETID